MGVGVATPAKELNRPIREKSTRMGFCFAQGSMTPFNRAAIKPHI